MPLDVIVGTQWGDEGKGRITDLLASQANIVARFNGGDNAGHTVTVSDQVFKLHLIPSGIVHAHTLCLMGAGMVINPRSLLEEIDKLTDQGVDASPARLKLSSAAHIITPAHIALDRAKEALRGEKLLGTTMRGIGPAYTDKTSRTGLRAGEMRDPRRFVHRLAAHEREAAALLEEIFGQSGPDADASAEAYLAYAERLQPYVADVGAILDPALRKGEVVLAEGAQGLLLDLDHGTYPYVTSSHPTVPGALMGLGVGAGHLRRLIGVTKAYQTRVGEGPLPTELDDEIGQHLRGSGANPWDEFGTTTGRPRRCGWLDTVLLRYAIRVNGLTELVITKLDILSGLNLLRLCSAYLEGGDHLPDLPDAPDDLARFAPAYENLPGWEEDLFGARHWEDLPQQAQAYIRRLESLTGLPATLISVGPERAQIVHPPA